MITKGVEKNRAPKEWLIPPPHPRRDELAAALRVSPVVAQVLLNRGIEDAETARQFLRPAASDLIPPEDLPGASEAAERIAAAIRDRRRIVLFGDYDVDGITGVSILWHCLRLAGGDPAFYIPHRLEEGYGISVEAMESLATDGAQLIVSVDCGVTAMEPARIARERGVELIITDHHSPHRAADGSLELPDALLVHPGLINAKGEAYPNPHLSGAGVALKVAWAVAQNLSGAKKVSDDFRAFLIDAMGLAALGTIADIVPLLGENRIIAHHGLLGLPQSRLAGVRALIASAGLTGKALDGYDIGFKMAPRLNAIGRMGHAQLAVQLLTRADEGEAMRIAENLEQQNKARQTLERKIAGEAEELVRAQEQDADSVRAIVLASHGWHAGVIGIVASRMTEMFGKPTVMIALEDGTGQGSARSIRNFALNEVLADCAEHLITYGGHAMAAGLRIQADRVDAFRTAFQNRAGQLLTAGDLVPKLRVDDVVSLDRLNESLVKELKLLAPFGAGNPAARLATDWLDVFGDPRTVGATGTHLQLQLTDGRTRCKGIAFGQAKASAQLADHRRCRVVFEPVINEWNGRRSVEMQVLDIKFPE
ncbi:MAG: single-stranded-DNA-specific exonuclease RecJ [Planctomycetota bacterium]